MTQQGPPGWFPDPAGTPQLRYFDGQQWTSNYSPLPPPPKRGAGGAGKIILGVIGALVLLVIIGNAVGGDDESRTSSSTTTSRSAFSSDRTASAPSTSARPTATTPTAAPAGSPVRDGKFEFRVLNVVQQDTVSDPTGNPYMTKEAQGVFYVLTLSVTNIGNEARGYYGANQKLIDASNREFTADSAADMYMNEHIGDINPGNSIQVKVAFDVPPGTVPAMLEVHDSMFSGGAKVRL